MHGLHALKIKCVYNEIGKEIGVEADVELSDASDGTQVWRAQMVQPGCGCGHRCVRALARLDLFPFLSPFSLYGLSYCMPELTSLISYCALS